tara:strand:+ start:24 stop:455 length:432 start_codon:yes stop_codon:yes gene_type:complete
MKTNDENHNPVLTSNRNARTIACERKVVEETFEITGRVLELGETEKFSSGFERRELVLLTEDYQPQSVKLTFKAKDIEHLLGIQINERVSVSFRLEGWSYEGRYFNCLRAFNLKRISDDDAKTDFVTKEDQVPEPNDSEDIPF